MLAVVVYHAGLPLRHGYVGVDIFFVISGFLITSILVRELLDRGTISWSRFAARRVRRLLPAAVTVLAVTGVVAWFAVPGLRRRGIGADLIGSAFYGVNWLYAHRAVDYLDQDLRPSPVQHFWSLAVEEQFYVLWPLALILLAVAVRLWRRHDRPSATSAPSVRAIAVLLAGICIPSFAWAMWLSAADPSRAYFVTTTRIWELGIGAGLAVWLARRPAAGFTRARTTVGWLGLAAVLLSTFAMPTSPSWPGPWTLLPTLGATAILYAGVHDGRSGAGRALGVRPLVWIGGLSYSLYLWHWPVLVLAEWAHDGLTGTQKVALALACVIPAWLSHRFLEQPIHHSRALATRVRASLALGAGLSAVGALSGLVLLAAPSPFQSRPVEGALPRLSALGASTLSSHPGRDDTADVVNSWDWLTPDPQSAGEDRPAADVDHCQVDQHDVRPVACTFGDHSAPTTIALVGDSKAMQWLPALQRAARSRGWQIVTYGKSSCSFSAAQAELAGEHYVECDQWNDSVMDRLRSDPPDLVVTSGHSTAAWDGAAPAQQPLITGLAARWRQLDELGIPVLAVGDNPVSPNDLDVCTARHPQQLTLCSFDRESAVAQSGLPAQRAASRLAPNAQLLDLTSWLCPAQRCPVAIGHVTVNRAGDHVTATYAATLAPQLAVSVEGLLPAGAQAG